MEMKLTTRLSIIVVLFMHHLTVIVTPIAYHTTLDNSTSIGISFPLVTNYTFSHGTDGFLHWMHSHRTDMLMPLGDRSSVTNITNQGPEMSIIPIHMPYTLTVSVGTGNGRQQYILKVDTSSILTWIQCNPCTPHARQQNPIFDPNASPTYQDVPGTSPLCKPPFRPVHGGALCQFRVTGPRSMWIEGYYAHDTFANEHIMPGFFFGCAHSAQNFESEGRFAGVISIGRVPTSLVMQLATRGFTHFSYCLLGGIEKNRQGFLRFGTDVPRNRHYRTTRILPAFHPNESEYYISLVGISLGVHRLDRVRPEMFARRNDGQGGCLIDINTPLTVLVREAYQVVEEAVWTDLQHHSAQRVKQSGFSLCVRVTKAIKGHFQSLSLHFFEEEAVLVFSPPQLFLMMNDEQGQIACLAMMPGQRTVIGAFQQMDTRFVYDIVESKLSFASESCSRDATQVV